MLNLDYHDIQVLFISISESTSKSEPPKMKETSSATKPVFPKKLDFDKLIDLFSMNPSTITLHNLLMITLPLCLENKTEVPSVSTLKGI